MNDENNVQMEMVLILKMSIFIVFIDGYYFVEFLF